MSANLGGIGAAAVTTIGTLAVVGMAAKVANNAVKNTGSLGRTYSRKRSSSHKKSYRKASTKKGYSFAF